MQKEISIEDAYKEACLALGEAIVRERLLMNVMGEMEASGLLQPDVEQSLEKMLVTIPGEGQGPVMDDPKGAADADGSKQQGQHRQNGKVPEGSPK